jgi:Uma2 family endonuclease
MAGAVSHPPIFSVAMFRDWITSRPDEQHWELIEGVPVMMAPPTAAHQRIVTNLENLLNDALAAHESSLEALPRRRCQHRVRDRLRSGARCGRGPAPGRCRVALFR